MELKIALVSPTWTKDLGIFSKLAKKRNSQPPLGILYLATVAERRNHTVEVIDSEVYDHSIESLANYIIDRKFDLVGITATSPIFHKAVLLAQRLKSKKLFSPLIIGGEHVNIFKKEAFPDCFDYGFFGESDFTFDQFLKIIEKGSTDFTDIKGFIYRENGCVIQNKAADRIENLDKLDFPAMHLLSPGFYKMTFVKFKRRSYLPIMATRGCPFKCAFCSEPLTNPHVRFRSIEHVVDEIEKWVKELGVTHYFFMDSNLTLNRNQISGICERILNRKLKITFEGWTRANMVDKEILKLLKQAGLIRMSYGIESGDPRILKIIRKEVSHEDMLRAFKLTADLGIEPACSVMLGLPGDTRESVKRTIHFVKNIPQISYSNFSIANPYPGTEMYEWSKIGKFGLNLLIDDFSQYRRYDKSPISVNDLSPDDLVQLQRIGLFKMHLTPKRIWASVKMAGFWNLLPLFIRFIITSINYSIRSIRFASGKDPN